MDSLFKELNAIKFPSFGYRDVHMQPFKGLDYLKLNLGGDVEKLIKNMFSFCSTIKETCFLTLDSKVVRVGETHRRGGPHVDGHYSEKLGWPERWNDYKATDGGLLMASSHSLCRGWSGEVANSPGDGGDCGHMNLEKLDSCMLRSNKVYLCNNTFIHESTPSKQDVKRQLIRITLPPTFKFDVFKENE